MTNQEATTEAVADQVPTMIETIKSKALEVVASEVAKKEATEEAAVEDVVEEAEIEAIATIEEATVLIDQGTQAMALGNNELATEKFSKAVEIQVHHLGQMAPECARGFYLYGKALLANAVQKNSVLGERADELKEQAQEQAPELDIPEKANFSFQGDDADDDEYEDVEEDEGKALGDIEIVEEADDLELAWENLDVARLILSKAADVDSQMRLGDVQLALGEVSLESENFDQAILDFTSAVELKNALLSPDHRERAEAHYKLALALEYSEQTELAIENVNASITVLNLKLESLKGTNEGKGKSTDSSLNEQEMKEVGEIEALFPEMEAKLCDLNASLEKEATGALIGEEVEEVVAENEVQDISGLVKIKRKEPIAATEVDAKKAKLDLE